jgi:predicted component of type VI protein secretion system
VTVVFNEEEPAPGTRHEFSADVTIGREGCDVTLADRTVSRRHAVIRLTPDGAFVEDLGSTHGTYVNGERLLEKRDLMEGDRVQFGGVVWRAVSGLPVPTAAPTIAPAMRGDVPMPTRVPSAIRPAIPATVPDQAFQPPAHGRRIRGSAARRVEATVVAYGIVGATAAALIVYFAQR